MQKILFDNEDPTKEDLAALDDMTDCLAADIQRERKRIGGDWVVAGCLTQARERDRIRYSSIHHFKSNKMELLQSQAPAERELLGNSADRTLDIGV